MNPKSKNSAILVTFLDFSLLYKKSSTFVAESMQRRKAKKAVKNWFTIRGIIKKYSEVGKKIDSLKKIVRTIETA
jgi:hypothetical protein